MSLEISGLNERWTLSSTQGSHVYSQVVLIQLSDFIVIENIYGHMIDNVVLIVTGTLNERDVQELLEKCHLLGMFDSIATLTVAQNVQELYRLVLVDTPLAPYFSEFINSELQCAIHVPFFFPPSSFHTSTGC